VLPVSLAIVQTYCISQHYDVILVTTYVSVLPNLVTAAVSHIKTYKVVRVCV